MRYRRRYRLHERKISLGDQIVALATGKTQQEIAAACKGARPNRLARHPLAL
jgi:hypothetical protein